MRNFNLNIGCLLLLAFVILSFSSKVHAQPDDWIITQLTDNSYDDKGAQIYGSNVVWEGHDGSDSEIFLYDGTTTMQLTNNNYNDFCPRIHGSNVVWQGSGEIFLYDGDTITQITDDSFVAYWTQIHGSNVVWTAWDGNDFEIFLYDGNSTIQLTNNDYGDQMPQIYGSNVVWEGYDGNDIEIFLYDGSTTTQITDNDIRYDIVPRIHGSNIAWVAGQELHRYDLFFYDGNSVTQLTTGQPVRGEGYHSIYGSNVAWCGYDGHDWDIFLYDGKTTTQVTDDDYYHQIPRIYGSNVVWFGSHGHGSDYEIYFYDGSTITQLTDNNYTDHWFAYDNRQIYGSDVVWQGSGEIFLATRILPPIEAEVQITPNTLNLQSKGKWIMCVIWLPEDYNVADIDVNSILLEDEVPVGLVWLGDEFAVVKFSRGAIQEFLSEVETPGEVELVVSGELSDGTIFEGTDTIRVIDVGGGKNDEPPGKALKQLNRNRKRIKG